VKPEHLYLGLAFAGTVLPLWQFAPFLRDHGLSIAAFVDQLFSTPVGGFFGSQRLTARMPPSVYRSPATA
jgi:hypothetical protein